MRNGWLRMAAEILSERQCPAPLVVSHDQAGRMPGMSRTHLHILKASIQPPAGRGQDQAKSIGRGFRGGRS